MSINIFLEKFREREGTALIVALLILIVLSLMGVYAVFTSTVETRIAGNERLLECAFYAADGGTDYGRRTIELILANQSLPAGANPTNDPSFGTTLQEEVLGAIGSTWDQGSPYVAPKFGAGSTESSMEIHIDRIKTDYFKGGSAEFGGGEESKLAVYYKIHSASTTTTASSRSQVQTTYRRVLP
jgi:Tfp pilus assembly protein PilX